jgi:2-polyprenyl-3-methyl-5-hydroxy-6-metoxy-1,4-benzoquinol methylase
LDSTILFESILQKMRFEKAAPHVRGSTLLDFGGNFGEFAKYVSQQYHLCNSDYSVLAGRSFDTITALAVLEHIKLSEIDQVIGMFRDHLNNEGRVVITTPASIAGPILSALSNIGLLDRKNIIEHKHYWNKKELFSLAEKNGFSVKHYSRFQLGGNQLLVLEKNG